MISVYFFKTVDSTNLLETLCLDVKLNIELNKVLTDYVACLFRRILIYNLMYNGRAQMVLTNANNSTGALLT